MNTSDTCRRCEESEGKWLDTTCAKCISEFYKCHCVKLTFKTKREGANLRIYEKRTDYSIQCHYCGKCCTLCGGMLVNKEN